MTHFAPGGTAQRADFAGGEGWKVIVVHVAFGFAWGQVVKLLGIRGVPSVARVSTCVSPRVNKPEPWARGLSTDLAPDGANVSQAAPVGADLPSSRMRWRTTFSGFVEGFLDLRGEGFILCGQLGDDFLTVMHRLPRPSQFCMGASRISFRREVALSLTGSGQDSARLKDI